MSSAPPAATVSAAERTRAATLGGVLFRNRGWLPVPFFLVPLLAPPTVGADQRVWTWVIGALLVAAAGHETRRRTRRVGRLVTYGAFAWTRNPLYVGNALIWIGFAILSGVYWAVPLAFLLFAVEYSLIVRYEEGVLESFFGEEYLAYMRRTPRWLPRPDTRGERGPHDWGGALKSEISTFAAYAALLGAMVVKARYLK